VVIEIHRVLKGGESPISHFLLGMVKDAALVVSVVKFGAKWDGSLPESKEYLASDHHTDRRSYEINQRACQYLA